MKKIPVFTFILCLFAAFSFSQNELDFNTGYHPQTIYKQEIEQNTIMTIKYIGDDKLYKMLKDNNMPNPKIVKKKTLTQSVIETGKFIDSTTFPLTITYTKTKSDDGKVVVPDGTVLYGYSEGKLPVLDSIFSENMKEETKKIVLSTVQKTYSQITLPEKKLKIGDSFSQDTPLSIPIGTVSIDMLITTTYKLVSIKNGIAFFDISVDFTMKSQIENMDIKAYGEGKGKLRYDIQNNFNILYKSEQVMKMNMKMEAFDLSLTSKGTYNLKTTITKK